MIGFMKKDIAMIKNNLKVLGVLVAFYLIMGLFGEIDMSFILPFMSIAIMISTFSYDELNNWNSYAATFPNGRKNSVKARYLTTVLIILIMTVITIILSLFISYTLNKSIDLEMTFLNMLAMIFGTALVQSFMYPIIFKFGVEKGRIMILVVIFGTVIVGGLFSSVVDLSKILNFLGVFENHWPLVLIVSSIAILYISYLISLRFQLKKEF